MKRIIIPAILLAVSIGLFVFYTNPTFQGTKTLAVQNAAYDDALKKSQELRKLRDDLLATRRSFAAVDVDKLAHVLPDNVDNIRLIIDINNIAARHRMTLTDVQLGDTGNTKKGAGLTSGPSGGAVGTVEVGFSVVANYEDLLAFLQDLEHSLRIVDIEHLTFITGVGDLNTYTFQIRTYWLH